MSQAALAEALGITFQQVLKYERGSNRVSASKLYEIGRALDVGSAHFFEGLEDHGGGQQSLPSMDSAHSAFIFSPEGAELASTLPRIPRPLRRKVVELVRVLADAQDTSGAPAAENTQQSRKLTLREC